MPFTKHKRPDDPQQPPWDATENRDASRRRPQGRGPAHGLQLQQDAEGLLIELYEATRGLGDALHRAGFAHDRWDTQEARLTSLSDRLPHITVEALLARLADFALDTGPLWLAGSGEARGEFAHEVEVLAAAIGPVAALARRGPTLATSGARGRGSLGQTLRDRRVGTQLERLDDALGQLLDLAPLLEPLEPMAATTPKAWPASGTAGALAPDALQGEQEGGAAALPEWPFGQPVQGGHEQALGAESDATTDTMTGARNGWRPGGRLVRAVWSWRTRMGVGIGLAALLLVLALSGTVALLHGWSASHLGAASGAQAGATVTHGRGAMPSLARTATAAAPTQAPGPAPTTLVVTPGNVVLPCRGAAVTLTVKNTGQQVLNWQASVSGNAALSATSGAVGPGSQATVSVHATGTQHGPGAIVFTSNGGTVKVAFKVSCH